MERANAAPSGGIFISYRRQDASHLAGRLYDRLADTFGEARIFMDVDTIDLGRVRAAPATGRGLGAGRPAGRPAPGGQLPVAGHPAADGPPHGPVDRLVAAPGAGRPGVAPRP
jgi:hypothetical protein